MSTHNCNSLTLQLFHVNLLFTEAVFSAHADNSLRTGCELNRTKLLTCTLLPYFTRAALSFSLSYKRWNPTYGERSAVYCCAWRHWGHVVLPTVARPSSYRVTQQHGERREGRQDAAALRYCCAIAFLYVSEFQQLPHGAITPHYISFFFFFNCGGDLWNGFWLGWFDLLIPCTQYWGLLVIQRCRISTLSG
jgi:hypothetical protein